MSENVKNHQKIIVDRTAPASLWKIRDSTMDDIINCSTHWHRFTIINGAQYDKVEVLRLIIDTSLPADLIPVKYQVDGKDTFFLARNCGSAIKSLCNLALTVTCPYTKKTVVLKLILCYLSLSAVPMVMWKHILAVNLCRLNRQQKLLDLTEYHNDPQLEDIFCPLSVPKSMLYVLRLCRHYLYNLTCLVLAYNNLTTLEHLEPLTISKTIKSLDVRYNKLDWNGLSKIPVQLRIKEIWLDGNPLCSVFTSPIEYIKQIKAIIPSMETLDDQKVCSPLDVCEISTKNFLVKPMSSCPFVDQFLEHFFYLFVGPNRSALIRMYHPKALFSMTVMLLNSQKTTQNTRMNLYMMHSRNLLKITDYSKSYQQLKSGPQEIFSVFRNMPEIHTDPYSLKVDVPFFEEDHLVLINVSGVFCEVKGMQLYFFHRSFVLHPCRVNIGEWKIVNDMLTITNTTRQDLKQFTMVDLPLSQMLERRVSGGCAAEKEQLISIVSDLTAMNAKWAEKFLNNALWDPEVALQAFTDQLKAEQVPTEAFDK